MKRHNRALALIAPLTALALIASACGDDGDGGTTPTDATPDVKLVDMRAVPYEEVPDGGTVTWAINQFPEQWNYNQVDGTQADTSNILGGILPNAFKAEEDGAPVPDGDLVTDFELTSQDPQVVTYTLNPDAVWDDGSPITWKDFEAQWQALNGKDPKFLVSSSTGYDRIGSVEQGDEENQVVVTYAKHFTDWQGMFSPLYPAATNTDPKVFNEGWVNKIGGVTAGPFKVDKIDETAKTITLVRNPKWWGRPAKLDRLIFKTLAADATADAYVNGEVDTFDIGPEPEYYKKAEDADNSAVYAAAAPDFRHVTFNGTSPVLKDKAVRQAIAMAINRDAISIADLKGIDWPALPLNNHFFTTGQDGFTDNAGDLSKYDDNTSPEKASELLEKAGWTEGDGGIREKDGKQLSVRIVIPATVTVSENEAKLITSMLENIGVKATTDTVSLDGFFGDYIIPGDFDLTVFSWLGGVFPISSSPSLYFSPKGTNIQQNYARIGVPAADKLMRDALGELDRAKAIDMINEADKLIFDNVQVFPLYQRPELTAVNADIANLGSAAFLSTDYTAIGVMKE